MSNKSRSNEIWIGGAPYLRQCEYHGWNATILSYDINTERHITIKTIFDEEKRVELDDDQLVLTEPNR